MATVGSTTCTFIHQRGVANLRQRGEVWAVPGVDGMGSRQLGQNDSSFAFECVYYSSSAGVEAWYDLIAQAQMTAVTIVDDWATTYLGCLIVQVSPLAKSPRVSHDGLGVCIGRCEISGVIVPVS